MAKTNLKVNVAGVLQDPKHIAKVEAMLEKIKQEKTDA